MTSEEARSYLREALAAAGVDMKAASELVGKNHAYIQQHLSQGKPPWLPELVREALARAYGLDAERMKPPPMELNVGKLRRNGRQQRHVDAPGYGEADDDPRKRELIDLWDRIPEARRSLVLDILRNLTSDASGSEVA